MMRRALLALGLFALTANLAEAKTWSVRAGPDAQARLQGALLNAKPGDTVRIERGRFELTGSLSLDTDRVTVRGAGKDRSILSFTGQTTGAEGLLVTSDDVTLRDFAVVNTKGDGIKSKGADRIQYLDLAVSWDGPPRASNGSYGVYPVSSQDVLIEGVEVRGASDAGIYVGQSRNIIVRKSLAEFNVAGIEIENCYGADVFENVSRHNAGGILVFDLPGLPQQGGHDVRVFNNEIVQNDTPNFAPAGNIVASVPTGTGVIVMANKNVHIFENKISDNGSANVIITAYRNAIADPNYNALPRDIVVRDNTFGRSGFAPGGELAALPAAGVALPDILWDGATTYVAGGIPRNEPVRISIKGNKKDTKAPVTFLSLQLSVASSDLSDAQPSSAMPGELMISEPPRVRLK